MKVLGYGIIFLMVISFLCLIIQFCGSDDRPGHEDWYDTLEDLYTPTPTATPTPVIPGSLWSNDPIVGNMRYIPATSEEGYWQGSPEEEYCRALEERDGEIVDLEAQFRHILTKSIAVMETEVTRKMWKDLQSAQQELPNDVTDPSHGSGMNYPVQSVKWYHTLLFANLLSLNNNFTPCYYLDSSKSQILDISNYYCEKDAQCNFYCDFDADGYRLPTEGEWEYFCRSGTFTPFYREEANYSEEECASCVPGIFPTLELIMLFCCNGGVTTEGVGSRIANNWNIYNLHGNVWEWCWDLYSHDQNGGVVIPLYPNEVGTDLRGLTYSFIDKSPRALRGGSFTFAANTCRSAHRAGRNANYPTFNGGFRLVRTLNL